MRSSSAALPQGEKSSLGGPSLRFAQGRLFAFLAKGRDSKPAGVPLA